MLPSRSCRNIRRPPEPSKLDVDASVLARACEKSAVKYRTGVLLDPPAKCELPADAVHAGHRICARAKEASRRLRLRPSPGLGRTFFAGTAAARTHRDSRRSLDGRLRVQASRASY